jgi:tetratricopeptide (TPR) repeat protein
VCEAELALVTAMPLIPESQEAKARLLLSEAIQDQGRWEESLCALPTDGTLLDAEGTSSLIALETLARWKSSQMREVEVSGELAKLLANLAMSGCANSKYLALEAVGRILSDTQSRQMSTEALQALKAGASGKESRKEVAAYAFLWAIASHFAERSDDQSNAERQLESALCLYSETSQGQGLISLLIALGSFKTSRGRYEEAIPYFERARKAAERLGTPAGEARAIANLMMSEVRIGRYSNVLEMAPRGFEAASLSKEIAGFRIVCNVAWSQAMLGMEEEARVLIQDKSIHFRQELPLWAIQAADLCLSDICFLVRSTRDSHRLARVATQGRFAEVLSHSYVGPFARAVTRIGIADRDERRALERVLKAGISHNCDLIDQAEIACARIQLNMALEQEDNAAVATLHSALRQLPPNTTETLRRLGFGQALQYASWPPKDEVLFQHPL